MNKQNSFVKWLPFIFTIVGILDAAYLTMEHYSGRIPPCSVSIWVDCGKVLRSEYAVVFSIPLAVLGLIHYTVAFFLAWLAVSSENKFWKKLLFFQTAVGVVASAYFVYLQIGILKAICLYCMVSAVNSLILYFVTRFAFNSEYKKFLLMKFAIIYQYIAKPIFFMVNPETMHDYMTMKGNLLGRFAFSRAITRFFLDFKHPILHQKIAKISFDNPVGLSAGFDYEARLPQILPAVGFGFETIGTITNMPYEGNPTPRLGRLPKSKSLLVNKGFRNPGAEEIINRLEGNSFEFPMGISIGRTNTSELKTIEDAIKDIIQAFTLFEKSKVNHSYYELNISCPNLLVPISFYESEHLEKLLQAVEKLKIKKPIFVKMPISKTDEEVKKMLDIITKYSITGVIFGNLQTNRKDTSLVKEEVSQWKMGNFSGKPTEKRSNELIKLVYKLYGKKLVIIGTGGIFSAEDAYKKIRLGASLVQLITGMIYQGPQLIAQINSDLVEMLKRDGFKNISEAVGVDNS